MPSYENRMIEKGKGSWLLKNPSGDFKPEYATRTEDKVFAFSYATDEGVGTQEFVVRQFFGSSGDIELRKVVKVGAMSVPNWQFSWQSASENFDYLIDVAESGHIISWEAPGNEWMMHRIVNNADAIWGE